MEINIKVKGMVCNGCENRIKNALSQIEGIKKVQANHNKELVTIKANEDIDINLIYKKITDLGFQVVNE